MSTPSFNENPQQRQQVNTSSAPSQSPAPTGMFTSMILNDSPLSSYTYQTPTSFTSGQTSSPSTSNHQSAATVQFTLTSSNASAEQLSQTSVSSGYQTTLQNNPVISSVPNVGIIESSVSYTGTTHTHNPFPQTAGKDLNIRSGEEVAHTITPQIASVRSSPGPASATETDYEQEIISRSKMFFSILRSVGDKFQTTPEVYESLSNLINGSITQQACQDRLKELLRFNESSRNTVANFLNDLLPIFRRQILNDRFDYSLLPVVCDKEKVRQALIQSKFHSGSNMTSMSNVPDSSVRLSTIAQQTRPTTVISSMPTTQTFVRAPSNTTSIAYVKTQPAPVLQANFRHIQPRPMSIITTNTQTRLVHLPVSQPQQTLVNGGSLGVSASQFTQNAPSTFRVVQMPTNQTVVNGLQPIRTATPGTQTFRPPQRPMYIATPPINNQIPMKQQTTGMPPAKKPAVDVSILKMNTAGESQQIQKIISRSVVKDLSDAPTMTSTSHSQSLLSAPDYQAKWKSAIRERTELYLSKQRSIAPTSLSYSPYLNNVNLTLSDEAIESLQQATQTFLRDMLSNLAMQARARSHHVSRHGLGLDTSSSSGFIDNTQAQLNFLKDVDKAEQKRILLQDHENCRRAAHSRTRDMDAETQLMRDRYREMTNAKQELEDMRASNLTAQNALGGSQKPRAWEQLPSKDSSAIFRGSTSSTSVVMGERLSGNVPPDESYENSSLNPMASGAYARLPSGIPIRPSGVLPRYRLQHDDLVRYIREQRLLNETSAFQKVLSRQLNKH